MEEADHVCKLQRATTETGRALLAAMCGEEPFQILSEIPGKLQALHTIGERKEANKRQLARDMVVDQSRDCELISSTVSLIHDWGNKVGSSLDLCLQHFQYEMDDIQALLEELHDSNQPHPIPRRVRSQGKLSSDLNNEILKLWDTSKRIQEISRFVLIEAEGLAADKLTLYRLVRDTAQEIGPSRSKCEESHMWACPDTTEPESGEETMLNGISSMERRCEELEAAILRNNEIIQGQMQEIDRLRRMMPH